MPGNPGNPDGSNPSAPAKDAQPTNPIPSKEKGPNSESSSKAPASKSGATTQPSAVAQGVQEHGTVNPFRGGRLGPGHGHWGRYGLMPGELHRFTRGTEESSRHHGERVRGSHGRYPSSGSFYLGRGNPARSCLCCWGFPGPHQLDGEVSTGHESRGEPVPAWPTCSLGSGPESQNHPIPEDNIPNHRLWTRHSIQWDIPGSFARLLPPYLGSNWGHVPGTTCHPSLLALLVRHSQSSRADAICHLHLYVQLQYRDLRDGHGPDRNPGLHHFQHLPGPAISLGGYMPDHPQYSSHQWKWTAFLWTCCPSQHPCM